MKQLHIFLAFFRVGIFGYGGGPSSIPLIYMETVEKYKWLDEDQFGDILALGNALPGPIATKMAGYIGYRVGGVAGMFSALLASVLPTILLMILLLTVLNKYKDQAWVSGMADAVVPVVAVMLATMAWTFIKKSSTSFLGWGWTLAFVVGSVIVLELLHVHPAILIAGLLAAALFKKDALGKEDVAVTGEEKDARGEMDAAVVGGEEGVPGREAVADVEDNKGASGKKAVVKDVEKGRSAGEGAPVVEDARVKKAVPVEKEASAVKDIRVEKAAPGGEKAPDEKNSPAELEKERQS